MALGGIGAFLTQHIGPVPMWAIVGVGGVGIAIFAPKLLSKLNIGGSSDASTSTPPPTPGGSPTAPYGPSPSPTYPPNPTTPPTPTTKPVTSPLRPMPSSPGSGQANPRRFPFFGRAPAQPVGPAGGPGGPLESPGPLGPPSTKPMTPPRSPAEPVPPGITPTPTGRPIELEHPGGPNQPIEGGNPVRLPPAGRPSGQPIPVGKPPQYVHPMAWPGNGSTLSELAAMHGVTLQRLEDLNGWIYKDRGTWNAIYPGDEIRIS